MKYILIALLITIGLIGYAQYQQGSTVATSQSQTQNPFIGADIGGPFTLTNQDGETVTEQDYADQYKLIYFGFTYCPSICPTELQKILAAYTELPQDQQDKITPMLISVDPERDTAPVMKEYVELFHPDLIGLTGTPEQVEDIKNEYRIYAVKVEDDSLSDYTVDHSTHIYLMNPDNELIDVFKIENTAEDILESLERNLR